MPHDNPTPLPKTPTRERVLDAAERLLAHGDAAFSMRELAQEAGVSFATPFNQFGSKTAIMHALSERRITAMRARLAKSAPPGGALARVALAVEIATEIMLEQPAVNRAVMAAIGAPADEPGEVFARSTAFWAEALGDGNGFAPDARALGLKTLPGLLAIAFRGVLSFWTAGNISDDALEPRARAAAAVVLLGFAGDGDRARLLAEIRRGAPDPDVLDGAQSRPR